MSVVRVLVGTRKGAFILTSDGKRKDWNITGPHFAGWEMYHLKASPADPDRIYASQSSGWFGQLIQRSSDGGKTWEPVGNKFVYDGIPGTHQWYDGTQHPWEFKRVWHLEPSLTDPDTVYAGVEDAALFRTTDGGQTWNELPGLRSAKGHLWQPGAGGMGLHSIVLDPLNRARIFVAISAAGVFRTDDSGATWRPINQGLKSPLELPDPTAEVGHCVHHIAIHPSKPDVLFMQKHWDVMRSDNSGDSWQKSAEIFRLILAFRSMSMRMSRRQSMSCPSRVIRSIFRRTASCAYIVAAAAGTNGKPHKWPSANRLLCQRPYATRWQSIPGFLWNLFRHDGWPSLWFSDAGNTWTAIRHDLPAVLP